MPNSASATADVIPVQPSNLMSKDEYWQEYKKQYYDVPGNVMKAPEHYGDFNYEIAKFFQNGAEKGFDEAYEAYKANWENDYNNYLNDINTYYENKAVQSARAFDEYMSNTAYQRAFKDLEKAGLNPYMLVGTSSIAPASSTSSAKAEYSKRKASSGTSAKGSTSNRNGRDMALILLALARLFASL